MSPEAVAPTDQQPQFYEVGQPSLPEMERARKIVPLLLHTLSRMPLPEGEGHPVPPALSLPKLERLLGLPKLRAAVSSHKTWKGVVSTPEGWEIRDIQQNSFTAGLIVFGNAAGDSYSLSYVGPKNDEKESVLIGFTRKERGDGGMVQLIIGQDDAYHLSLMYRNTPLRREESVHGQFINGKLVSREVNSDAS